LKNIFSFLIILMFLLCSCQNQDVLMRSSNINVLNLYFEKIQSQDYNAALKLIYFDVGYEELYDFMKIDFEKFNPTYENLELNKIIVANDNVWEIYSHFLYNGEKVNWTPYILLQKDEEPIIVLNYSNIPAEYKENVTNNTMENALDFKEITVFE